MGRRTFLVLYRPWKAALDARYCAAMPGENVEIVRGVVDAYARRDFDAIFKAYDREIEWHIGALPFVSDFEPVYYGHDGVRSFWRIWFEAWETASFDYEEFHEVGDRVLTVLSQRLRGRTSGVEVDWRSYGQIWTIAGGLITRVEFFTTRAEAFEAAGLST